MNSITPIAVPSMAKKLIVASGSAAIATDDAVIKTDRIIHRPSAIVVSDCVPRATGGTDQITPSAMPSSTVSRTASIGAVGALR